MPISTDEIFLFSFEKAAAIEMEIVSREGN